MAKKSAPSAGAAKLPPAFHIGVVGPWRGDLADLVTQVAPVADPQSAIGDFDMLLVTFVGDPPCEWTDLLAAAATAGVSVRYLAEYLETARGRMLATRFDKAWGSSAPGAGYRFRKPLFDIAIIIVTAPASLAICALIAIAVGLSMGWPILHQQERVGQNGVIFQMWKFRTMRKDARGAPVTAVDDPRVTRVGRWLRRLHVDELPQLFNVLGGDMSLVGPRPEQPALVSEYTLLLPEFNFRLRVPAGMTGWAQINSPYAGDFSQSEYKLSFDMYYMANRSLVLDAKILVRTMCGLVGGLLGG